jgi:hypothetical protein
MALSCCNGPWNRLISAQYCAICPVPHCTVQREGWKMHHKTVEASQRGAWSHTGAVLAATRSSIQGETKNSKISTPPDENEDWIRLLSYQESTYVRGSAATAREMRLPIDGRKPGSLLFYIYTVTRSCSEVLFVGQQSHFSRCSSSSIQCDDWKGDDTPLEEVSRCHPALPPGRSGGLSTTQPMKIDHP